MYLDMFHQFYFIIEFRCIHLKQNIHMTTSLSFSVNTGSLIKNIKYLIIIQIITFLVEIAGNQQVYFNNRWISQRFASFLPGLAFMFLFQNQLLPHADTFQDISQKLTFVSAKYHHFSTNMTKELNGINKNTNAIEEKGQRNKALFERETLYNKEHLTRVNNEIEESDGNVERVVAKTKDMTIFVNDTNSRTGRRQRKTPKTAQLYANISHKVLIFVV